ncbi:glycosyltransferase family 2 protein [Aequorivita xiaoshiensis]|uniref:Glycosyltransferase family 2 protein n=1 Tax=Aequorivita xiaoshiensis TaxID=2874476 RepID=A0A9X1QZ32_9FLAO|nr:glycosyltransferase family 2 protein [Aequorivita xiaoshiensis]MCG2430488.1 glycosyltransferase family 2 protein [Aequorivita xiaoshiensis]
MSSSSPLVSVIIPTYNRAHLIGETLDSVLAQTYQNWECIVVDDGSTDGTDELMADYMAKDARFQYHHRPKDRLPGGNAARNYGFEMSKGEYIQWFDSDDLMMPEKIELKINWLLDKKVDFVVCEGAEITDKKNLSYVKKWKLFETDSALLEHIKGNLVYGTNGPLFNKQYLIKTALFDEELRISQEWEFFSRLLISSPKVGIINIVLYLYRNEADGKRSKTTKFKLVNKAIAISKIVDLYSEKPINDTSKDFEVRKYLFNYIKLYIKRCLKHKLYSETSRLVKLRIKIINYSFLKDATYRFLKNQNNVFKVII